MEEGGDFMTTKVRTQELDRACKHERNTHPHTRTQPGLVLTDSVPRGTL